MEEFEFKIVGKDENGNPLYQKVPKQQPIQQPIQQKPVTQESATFNVPTENKTPQRAEQFQQPQSTNFNQQPVFQQPQEQIQNQPVDKPQQTKTQYVPAQKSPTQPTVNTVKNKPNDFLYVNMNPEMINLKHQESVKKYPRIPFRDKEFVVKIVNRHPIGLIVIWSVAGIVSLLMMVFWALITFSKNSLVKSTSFNGTNLNSSISIIFFSVILMSVVFAYIVSSIYSANKLIVTSERVVQYMSNGLFDKKKQTIDLGWIEDVSYHKTGIIAAIFNYGSIRLSTIGDESTYYLKTVKDPATISSQLNELVLAVKNQDPMPNLYD